MVPDFDSGFVSGFEVPSLDCLTVSIVARNVFNNINMPKEILLQKTFIQTFQCLSYCQDNTNAEVINHIRFRQSSAA